MARCRPAASLGLLLAAAALASLAGGSARGQPVGSGSGGVALRQIGLFTSPTYVTAARGFPKLTFVTEQAGLVRVLRHGAHLARPFLDISSLVGCDGPGEPSCGERGLLSIAFPSDYKRTRRLYVYYTDGAGNIQVDEFRRSRNPARARASTRRPVITIPHPGASNHNGGQLQFHGKLLLLGTGDGGSAGDPPNNAQNPESLLGKLLRIDPRNPKGPASYRIPAANPFVGGPGRDEVFSFGLRNPYRFTLDVRRGPDRIAIGDVGQNRFEEIDYTTVSSARGANFGWDAFEGFARYDCGIGCPNGGTPDPGNTTPPILHYGPGGCSVIGGYVVRDRRLASLYRRYLYVDTCLGELRSLIATPGSAADDKPVGVSVDTVVSFGQRPNGALYLVSLLGPVYRIVRG
jgi:glucose/arabinose dehydrogenase